MKKSPVLLSLSLALASLSLAVSTAYADTLAFYNFDNTIRNSASGPPAEVALGVTATDVTRGSGLITDTTVGVGYLNANGFNGQPGAAGTQAAAIASNDYFTFTVGSTSGSGNTVDFTRLDLQVARSNTGPTNFFLRSSVDGFANDLASATNVVSTAAAGTEASPTFTPFFANFSGAGFTGISTPIEFRVFGFGAVNTAGGSGGVGRIDNIRLQGTVNGVMATPEPETWAMMFMGVGALAMFAWKRKRSEGEPVYASGMAI